MSVDKATVAKIASLARIRMDDAELERMVPELNGILQWVEQLGEVDEGLRRHASRQGRGRLIYKRQNKRHAPV